MLLFIPLCCRPSVRLCPIFLTKVTDDYHVAAEVADSSVQYKMYALSVNVVKEPPRVLCGYSGYFIAVFPERRLSGRKGGRGNYVTPNGSEN